MKSINDREKELEVILDKFDDDCFPSDYEVRQAIAIYAHNSEIEAMLRSARMCLSKWEEDYQHPNIIGYIAELEGFLKEKK